MKTLRTYILFLMAAAAVAFSAACQRDPIEYPTSNYYVAISVIVETDGATEPTVYAVVFYDPSTQKEVYRTFIYADQHPEGMPVGGYVTGIDPGEYDMLVYNVDTRVSEVYGADWLTGAYAASGVASRVNDVPVIYAPDHLYRYCGRVTVPYITVADGVYVIEAPLRSTVEDWNILVLGVKNLDIAQSVTFLVSGQTRGRMMKDGAKLTERSIVTFAGEIREGKGLVDIETKSGESLVLYTPYTTFGKLDGDQRVLVTLAITGPGGSTYYGQADVTQQVLDQQEKKDRLIIIDSDIDIKPREQGGFSPEAKPWDPEVVQIELE